MLYYFLHLKLAEITDHKKKGEGKLAKTYRSSRVHVQNHMRKKRRVSTFATRSAARIRVKPG